MSILFVRKGPVWTLAVLLAGLLFVGIGARFGDKASHAAEVAEVVLRIEGMT